MNVTRILTELLTVIYWWGNNLAPTKLTEIYKFPQQQEIKVGFVALLEDELM